MEQLKSDISAFCERHKMAKSDFGRFALNDPAFVGQIENKGRRVWPETEAKIRSFMAEYSRGQAA